MLVRIFTLTALSFALTCPVAVSRLSGLQSWGKGSPRGRRREAMHLTCRRRLPLAKVQEVPAELLQEVCDEKLMPIWAFCLTLLLEVGVWVGIYWRDYSYSPNIEIGHYFSFQTITDLSAWRLPANRRSWWNPFRAIVAISFIFFEVSVLINGAEKFGPLVIVRLALCTLRLIHALTCMKVYGPSIRQWTALPAYVRFHLEHISAVPLLLVAWACVGWFCPYVFILMHYNYGELRLDGPLTALQDTYVVTVVLKSFMMDVLNASPLQAGMSEILSCMLFSAQYPVIFDMYWLPPLRMGHLLAEVLFGTIGLCYLFLDLRLVFDSSMVCSVEP